MYNTLVHNKYAYIIQNKTANYCHKILNYVVGLKTTITEGGMIVFICPPRDRGYTAYSQQVT